MRIEAVESVGVALPFREPYTTSRGTLRSRDTVLLRVHADGLVGVGEGVPLTLRGGADAARVIGDLRGPCAEVLHGAELGAIDAAEPARARDGIAALVGRCRSTGISAPALAAVDIALHDLAARAAQIPLHELLGAARFEPVRCNATLGAGTPDAVAAAASLWRRRGFDSYKLKVGTAADLSALAAVRDAVGRHARIRIDANGAWGVEHATVALRQMQPLGLELAEQPVATVEELAGLRERTPVPLAADESVNDAAQAAIAFELRACDLVTVKLSKVGGLGAALEVASVLPMYLSSALDGPVGIAAAAHLAQALPGDGPWAGIAHGLATLELYSLDPAASGPELEGHRLTVPESPGHGVELDWEMISRLTTRP